MGPVTLERDVEEAALELFADLGWSVVRAMHESFGKGGTLGRETTGEVVVRAWLRPALVKAAIRDALEALPEAYGSD